MGSYENIVKIEELKRKVEEGDLLSAQKILDTIQIKKIKNMTDLNLMAEVYAENGKYEEAAELYLKIYEKIKSRKALYQLVEVAIKLNNVEDAEHFLGLYQKMASKDIYNNVFRYKIDKMEGKSFEHLIAILEDLKRMEYTEKWAYELAKLYYKAGMEEECIRECNDIELWFGEGTYVEKAKILRSYYSGDTDKNGIMEEIKRRAEIISNQSEIKDEPLLVEDDQDETDDETETEVETETEIETEIETETETETEQTIINGLKTEHNITNGLETEQNITNALGAVRYEDDYNNEDSYDLTGEINPNADFMVHEDTEEFVYGLKMEVQNILTNELVKDTSYGDENAYYVDERSLATEREQAEEEVEKTIYHLLEEDSLDEEDKKLKQLADELQINPAEIFGNFLHILSIKKQLVKGLESIMRDRSKTLMMIITGAEGTGKTTLAKDIALFFYQSGKLKSSKVAKITAAKLNSVDIMSKKDTLQDCCLVIENASELKRRTIDKLLELTQCLQEDIAVIFEEDKKNMNKLFREYPKLMDLLKNRIHLPQYTLEDLMGFAYACLKQEDYRLNPNSEKLLQDKINQIAKHSEPHRHLEQIYDLMQTAMNAADIRMGKRLTELASMGRLKDVEVLSVIAEDFIG